MKDNNTAIQPQQTQDVNATRQQGEPTQHYTPLVDIYETKDAFIFRADLPGVTADNLDISYEDGVLTIEGKVQPHQTEGQRAVWQEYGVGGFYRQFTLNTPVQSDAIQANLKNGELTLTVPKAEHAKVRKIDVKTA
jgi:HSP20 family molecular chaperone IbpA